MYLPENVDPNCGVYRIVNRRNGKIYIGSTKNAKGRKKTHFRHLKRGNHTCTPLQSAWNAEFDTTVFEFQMFIYCKPDDRFDLEQNCIDIFEPDYNVCKTVNRPPDLTGYKQTPEHRKNSGAAKKGIPLTDEHKQALSESHLGQEAWNKGQDLSDAHKKSLSEAKLRAPKKRHVVAKLDEKAVFEILASVEPMSVLAERYCVSMDTISRILRNTTWKYIPRTKIWTVTELRQRGWTPEKRAIQAKTSSEINNFANLSHEQRSEAAKTREQNFTKEQKRERAMMGVEARRLKKLARLAVAHPRLDWPSGGLSDHNANALLTGYLL